MRKSAVVALLGFSLAAASPALAQSVVTEPSLKHPLSPQVCLSPPLRPPSARTNGRASASPAPMQRSSRPISRLRASRRSGCAARIWSPTILSPQSALAITPRSVPTAGPWISMSKPPDSRSCVCRPPCALTATMRALSLSPLLAAISSRRVSRRGQCRM